jgi:hypothetical protein
LFRLCLSDSFSALNRASPVWISSSAIFPSSRRHLAAGTLPLNPSGNPLSFQIVSILARPERFERPTCRFESSLWALVYGLL